MKKVLSFVLVLSLVLGSFSMAFAAPANSGKLSDIAGSANEEAITVVNDLGIVTGYTDGTFKGEQAVNRAEFAAMITRALAIPESALAGYSATTFKDTTGYGWAVPYLAFCESKGIMLGDGNGNAMPGRTITVNEAMTMVLRAIGLTNNSAFLVGSWPANYVTIAKNEGLYDDVAAVSTVDRGSAAQIIYNTLTVSGFAVNTDGDTTRTSASLLNALDCTESEELVKYIDDSLIALTEYVGAWANVYRNDDGEIVAVDPISTFLTGQFSDDGSEFEVDDVTYDVDPVTSIAGITNAAMTVNAYADNEAIGTATNESTVTIAAEVKGKTLTKVYSVATWTPTVYAQAEEDVQDEINDDQKLFGVDFALDKSKEIDATAFTLFGVNSLDDIAKDDVIYVYAYDHDSSKEIVKIEVGTKTVTGQVTRVFTDDGTTYYRIDGENYTTSNVFAGTEPKVGDEGTAVLDYAGDIYDWDADSTMSDNYAVVTGEYKETGRDFTIVLLDKDGIEKEYIVTAKAQTTASGLSTPSTAIGSIVTFSLDKNGKINDIAIQELKEDLTGKTAKDGSLIGKTVVANNIVVFVQDENDDFSIGKVADFDTDIEFETITHGAVLDNSKIAALVVADKIIGNSDASYGIITKADAEGLNADKDVVQLLNVFVDGKEMTDVVTDDLSETVTTSSDALRKISIDADGVITKVEDHGLTAEEVVEWTLATVSSISGRVITLGENDASESYRIADGAVIYVWDDENSEWTIKSSLSSLRKLHVSLFDTDDDTVGFDVVMAK